jgi:hypothetical protein
VRPIVDVSDGEEVEVLGAEGQFYKAGCAAVVLRAL